MKILYLIRGTVFLLLLLGSCSNLLVGYNLNSEALPPKQADSRAAVAYTTHAPISITSDADFEIQGWPGNGTQSDPYVISWLNITSTDICIDIRNTRSHFTVTNCIISSPPNSNYGGLYLYNVANGDVRDCIINSHVEGFFLRDTEDCILINNTASGNLQDGFVIFTSDNCTITNNTATDNTNVGFLFSNSGNCTMTNNTAIDNIYGIRLITTVNCSLTNNTVIDNTTWGFCLETYANNCTLTNNTAINSHNGFALDNTDNCTLISNTAKDNSYTGFLLGHADNCTLLDNTATNNALGFKLYYSNGNTLYGNMIASNGANAEDEGGVDNVWDDGVSSGNYWDDYDGSGVYTILGSSGSVDRYPFIWDIVFPSIDNPKDVSYAEGTTGHSITWAPADAHPSGYAVYRNGTAAVSDVWNGSQIIVNVDGLIAGIYNYTLVVTDGGENTARDEVLVTVFDQTPPNVENPADIQYNESSTGHSITWHASDLHPHSYAIYKNETPVKSGSWNSSSEVITISVDGLAAGIYNYTLVVTDVGGNAARDEVFVTVVNDTTYPIIDSPTDIQYDEFTTGHSITWHPDDLYPVNYVIYKGETPVKSGAWNSSSEVITISVDGLSLGTYNYTIVLTDIGENTASDTVIVTVIEASTTTTTTTTPTTTPTNGTITTIVLIIGSSIVIIIIITIVLKKRGI